MKRKSIARIRSRDRSSPPGNGREIANREPDKGAGWEWKDASDLPANVVPYARHALGEIMHGRRIGIFGW